MKQISLAVVGQGYVGLPLAVLGLESGLKVLGLDIDPEKVARLNRGQFDSPDISLDQAKKTVSLGYRATLDFSEINGFDYVVITVPTPLLDGAPDLSYVEAAADQVARHISRGTTVILESTTYPGTTRDLVVPILEEGSGFTAGSDFMVGYSPERIDPGNEVWNLGNTPKVVGGLDSVSLRSVVALYASLGIALEEVDSLEIAEMSKLIENTFRHVNIALMNELAMFSGALGVDIWKAIEAAATKPFGFMRFLPGPGVGGHCLPIDPSYLSWKVSETTGHPFEFVELANKINDGMPEYVTRRVLEKVEEIGSGLVSSHLLIWGLAYKPNTGDIRQSPSLAIVKLLLQAGFSLAVYDPLVPDYLWPPGIPRVVDWQGETFDLCVVVTAQDMEGLVRLQSQEIPVLDTRNVVFGENVTYL